MQSSKQEYEISATTPSGSERVFGDRVRRGAPSGSIGPNTVEHSDDQQFWSDPKGEYREMESDCGPVFPGGNDAIDPELCSLSYCGVEDAAKEIARQGRNAVIAKVDVKSAYRVVPVHPDYRWLPGIK